MCRRTRRKKSATADANTTRNILNPGDYALIFFYFLKKKRIYKNVKNQTETTVAYFGGRERKEKKEDNILHVCARE